MEIGRNFSKMREKTLKLLIETEVETFLSSDTDTYVVFYGASQPLFIGTLQECYIYKKHFEQSEGYEVDVYSKEMYDKMRSYYETK